MLRTRGGQVGWGAVGLVAALGAVSGGAGGALVLGGLAILMVAGVALARGSLAWAGLRSRRMAALAAGAGVMAMGVGTAVADPAPPIAADRPPAAAATTAALGTPTPPSRSAAATSGSATRPTVRPTPRPVVAPRAGTALAALATLQVKGRAPKSGYSRDQFGASWATVGGCDTRQVVLRRDLRPVAVDTDGCTVVRGVLTDPYTGRRIAFRRGPTSSDDVQIDHVVSLSDAWQKGAQTWTAAEREAFANDPVELLAVDGAANAAKSDSDAASWLPPAKSYRCVFIARQITVKSRYRLWVTNAEKAAMARVLAACPAQPVVGAAAASRALAPFAATAAPPAASPPPANGGGGAVSYENCDAVRAAGAAPIHRGQPGYSSKLDRDGDGVACET